MSWKEEFDKKSEEENYWMNQDGTITHTTGMSIKETKQFISDLRKKDEEELIKMVEKIKIGFDSKVAKKYLKPQSAGFNDCVYKLNIKINQTKQLIKDYYEN